MFTLVWWAVPCANWLGNVIKLRKLILTIASSLDNFRYGQSTQARPVLYFSSYFYFNQNSGYWQARGHFS